MTDLSRVPIVESVLQHHLPIEFPDTGKVMCLCHGHDDIDAVFRGPVFHRRHVARLVLAYLDRGEPEPPRYEDDEKAEGERGTLDVSRSTPSEPSREGDGAPILRPGEVLCDGDCTVGCGRCKGQPYFTRRSMSGRFALVLWRESAYPAASFNRGDFNDADERASALTDELNAASAVTNGPVGSTP